jgi:hypothetical protein
MPRASLRSVLSRLVLLLIIAPLSASNASAQSEDQVMAAFLLNFARYVEWPATVFASADTPVRICMMGSPAFGEVVSNTVSGKNVGDRAVTVVMKSDLASTRDCHVLFIGSGGFTTSNADAIAVLGHASVFTVADREGFANDGGIANFFRDDNKIRFEINPKAAKKADLKISSRLLRLAKVVN